MQVQRLDMEGLSYDPSADAMVAAATFSPIPSLLSAPLERSYSLLACSL